MSKLTNRLNKLEKRTQPSAVIGDTSEQIRAPILGKLDAVLRGEVLPAQPSDPAADELRADILQRLERIANEQVA